MGIYLVAKHLQLCFTCKKQGGPGSFIFPVQILPVLDAEIKDTPDKEDPWTGEDNCQVLKIAIEMQPAFPGSC